MKMKISNETREKIIHAYNNGDSKKDISRILNVKLPSVYAIIDIFLKERRVEKKLKGGDRKKALNSDQIQIIQNLIDDDCSISLGKIKEILLNVHNIDVSIMTVSRCIKAFNYTFKSITLIPQRRNDLKSLDDREAYARRFFDVISDIDETKLYFVDEVGFNVSMRGSHGRSLRGTNAVKVVPGLRSRNISVCCAMSKMGVTLYNVQTTAYNTATFTVFIGSLLKYIESEQSGKSAIILDNVPFHKNCNVKEMVESKGHILLFLPPYSPFLNPIENMFSKWKQAIKAENPTNESHLFELINNVHSTISADDCAAFYRNMLRFLPQCISRAIITEG